MDPMKIQEKLTAWAFPAAIGGVIFYFWGKIVPFVLETAENTLHASLYCLAIAALFYVLVLDGNLRKRIFFFYRELIRMMWAVNPIGNLTSLIESAQKRKNELEESIKEITQKERGVKEAIKKNIAAYNAEMTKFEITEKQAQDPDEEIRFRAEGMKQVIAKQIARLEPLIKAQNEHLKKYQVFGKVLARYSTICENNVLDMQNARNVFAENRESSRSFAKGMRAALRNLKGSTEEQAIKEISVASLERDYAKQMGDAEDALRLTKNVILQADFNDVVAMEQVNKQFEKWKGGGNVLQDNKGGQTKQLLLTEAEQHIPFADRKKEPLKVAVPNNTIQKMFD